MNEYSQEQIDRANAVSLVDFLKSQGERRLKKASEILGISFSDISGQVEFIEKEE